MAWCVPSTLSRYKPILNVLFKSKKKPHTKTEQASQICVTEAEYKSEYERTIESPSLTHVHYIDGLVQDYSISIANAL